MALKSKLEKIERIQVSDIFLYWTRIAMLEFLPHPLYKLSAFACI